jgi:hypothetical protein
MGEDADSSFFGKFAAGTFEPGIFALATGHDV